MERQSCSNEKKASGIRRHQRKIQKLIGSNEDSFLSIEEMSNESRSRSRSRIKSAKRKRIH